MQPVLSILVVSYNTREMTLACLRSVVDQTQTPFELIVIDNASTDGSAQAIQAEFPNITLLAEHQNHGFAGANNIAARHAIAPWILLLNPDTVVLNGALDRLVEFAERTPEARIWGGRTVFADGTLNPSSCWRKMSVWNLFCRAAGLTAVFPSSPMFNAEAYGGWNRMTERSVDIVTGCLFLMRRDDWERLEGFDPAFFMYAEEADLCLRASKQIDARPRVTPDAVIIHHGGASETARADKMVRLLRAKRALISRHFPAWQGLMAKTLFDAWPLTRTMAHRFLARFHLRPKAAESAAVWSDVWSRRVEWRGTGR